MSPAASAANIVATAAEVSRYAATPEADCVVAIGQMIEAIAASQLTPAEKKQVDMLRQAYAILFDDLKNNKLSPEILAKLDQLTNFLVNREFSRASAIQTVSLFHC